MQGPSEVEAAGEAPATNLGAVVPTAIALVGVHVIVAVARDLFAHQLDGGSAAWRAAHALPPVALVGLVAAVVGAWLVGRGIVAGLVTFVLFAWSVSGIGFSDLMPLPESGDTKMLAAIGGSSALGAALALGVVHLAARTTRELQLGGVLVQLAVYVVLVVGLPIAMPAPRMVVREVARALLEDADSFRVLAAHDRFEPEPGTITPIVDWRARGGDRAALVMAPGTEVEFDVRPEDGPVRLVTSIGIDQGNVPRMKNRFERLDFHFEVLVNGALRFEKTLLLSPDMEPWENQWHPVIDEGMDEGDASGIPLAAGDVVTLRTAVSGTPESGQAEVVPWRIGFSDLVLERRRSWQRTRSSADAPNVVLILMDTQRRDRLGCYGYERDVSPRLDRLAERGTLYEEAYSTSAWTWPSTASVLTGLRPEAHGVLDGNSCYLARSIDSLAEVMQRAGMTTAAFSGSPLIVPATNFDQGFEYYDGWKKSFRKSPLLVPQALQWMEAHAGTRFFLYLHLVDTHDPHRPTEEALERFAPQGEPTGMPETAFTDYTWDLRRGKARSREGDYDTTRVVPTEHQLWLSDLYDACVFTGDEWIGKVLDKLDVLGLADETVVAFTADHGEEFFEHGMLEHGHALFDEVVGVPLILAGPGVPAGVRSDVPISNRHLAPTLARIAGVEFESLTDGFDLASPATLEPAPVLFGTHHGFWKGWYRTVLQGLRDGERVLHWAPVAGDWWESEPTPGGEWQLLDASEASDLTDAEPDRADAMRAELERILVEAAKQRVAPSFGGGETTREMLEGIGYLESGDDGSRDSEE